MTIYFDLTGSFLILQKSEKYAEMYWKDNHYIFTTREVL